MKKISLVAYWYIKENIGNSNMKYMMLHWPTKPMSAMDTQKNSSSISHLLDTVTTQLLDSVSVVTDVYCRQQGDYTAIGIPVTVLPAVINEDYTVTV